MKTILQTATSKTILNKILIYSQQDIFILLTREYATPVRPALATRPVRNKIYELKQIGK